MMGHPYHQMKRGGGGGGGGIVHGMMNNNNGMGIISSARAVKMAMGILGMCVVGYIAGPPLYWHFVEGIHAYRPSSSSSSSCPPCFCDCSSSFPFFSLPQGLNKSFTDCMKHDPEVSEEMEKHFADLVADELRQKEEDAMENQRRSDMALLEAKKVASQYQKEADKCNSGMETCEEARERAEEALEAQRKITAMWEQRARQKGWNETIVTRIAVRREPETNVERRRI